MGYGVSSQALLSFGITPAIASASVHTAEGFVDIVSGVSHWKFGNVDKSMILDLLITGVIGAIFGACVLIYYRVCKAFRWFDFDDAGNCDFVEIFAEESHKGEKISK